MNFDFKFKLVEPGTIYLIPRFVKCIHCDHEIPIGEIMDDMLSIEILNEITDNGGCGKSSNLAYYARYFGVIKNISF